MEFYKKKYALTAAIFCKLTAKRFRALRSVLCAGLVGGKTDAKPVLYEGEISRTTLSSKHVKRKRKNERGKH